MARESFDCLVVGAGFSGIGALKRVRDELGLKCLCIDTAGDVGVYAFVPIQSNAELIMLCRRHLVLECNKTGPLPTLPLYVIESLT